MAASFHRNFSDIATPGIELPGSEATTSSQPRTLLHAFPTFEIGGSQIRFAALANHHGPRYRHLIVSMDGKTDCIDRIRKDVMFEILKIEIPKNSSIPNFFDLRRILHTIKPDVLVTYNWGSIEWALANIVPVCCHVHIEDGFGPEEAASRQYRRRSLFRRLVLSKLSRVVLPSKTLMKIATGVWHLPPQNLSYIPNGIDCSRFMQRPDATLAIGLRRQPQELLIGTVAALRPEKNIARLIEAFIKITIERPARLIIIGDGVERGALQQLAADRGVADDILFTGAITNPERFLAVLDVFALSSNTEQMPFSILEAMAAGLPIASVDVGDVREMVAADNRPFVVAQSAEELARAMTTLLRDSDIRAKLGQSNLARVHQHYDQATMFERYAALFDS